MLATFRNCLVTIGTKMESLAENWVRSPFLRSSGASKSENCIEILWKYFYNDATIPSRFDSIVMVLIESFVRTPHLLIIVFPSVDVSGSFLTGKVDFLVFPGLHLFQVLCYQLNDEVKEGYNEGQRQFGYPETEHFQLLG
jgi:hypothetical protein